ncbi:MAG: hypothetical protein ACI9SE_003056 [Neolewinella sp.]|jgi:hypothetical protein
MSTRVTVPLILASFAASVAAQELVYARVDTAPNPDSIVVWDSERQVVIAREREPGGRQWQWDGVRWTLRVGDDAPGFTRTYAGAFDSVRAEFVLFGSGQTMAWDGGRWQSRSEVPIQQYAKVVFDSSRDRMIEHYPWSSSTSFREWNGISWTPLPATLPGPGYRGGAAIAYDESNQRTVVYGGVDLTTAFSDCWSWDGVSWTLLSSNSPPGPRSGASLAYDPLLGRLVMYGGIGAPRDTWVLTGSTWTQVVTTSDPGSRWRGNMVFDGAGMLLLGGGDGEQWRFVNSDWQRVAVQPLRREGSAFGYDQVRQELLMFGGRPGSPYADTWTYDGAWSHVIPATTPMARSNGAMAWSSINAELLLFGGQGSVLSLGDTWLWDGANWNLQAPATSPAPRAHAAIAEDPFGGVMMFGGLTPTPVREHWYWDGTTWAQLSPAVMPPALSPVVAGFDHSRQRTMLFGANFVQPAQPQQMWEWDGLQWTQIALPAQMGVYPFGLAYDWNTGRMVLDGAVERWEFDGSLPVGQQWIGPVATYASSNRSVASAAALGGVFGYPMSEGNQLNQAASLGVLTETPADAVSFGQGCSSGSIPTMYLRGRMGPAYAPSTLVSVGYAPLSVTVMALGLDEVSVPLSSGCELLVGTMVASLAFATDASGDAELTLPLPASNVFLGLDFVAQAATADPVNGLFAGWSLSDGLLIRVGR